MNGELFIRLWCFHLYSNIGKENAFINIICLQISNSTAMFKKKNFENGKGYCFIFLIDLPSPYLAKPWVTMKWCTRVCILRNAHLTPVTMVRHSPMSFSSTWGYLDGPRGYLGELCPHLPAVSIELPISSILLWASPGSWMKQVSLSPSRNN